MRNFRCFCSVSFVLLATALVQPITAADQPPKKPQQYIYVLHLVPRLYDATAGRVLVDGADVREVQLDSLRHATALVTDDPFLFSASVHENIAYARPDASREDVEAAARRAQAHEFVAALPEGYDTLIGKRGLINGLDIRHGGPFSASHVVAQVA